MTGDAEWRRELRAVAAGMCERFRHHPGVAGIVLGGSLARAAEWRHSDVEIGILVEESLTEIGHFNVEGGRGVEVFQLFVPRLCTEVARTGDAAVVARWPIQLYRCRVMYDPSGLFARFKDAFDARLFAPDVVAYKCTAALAEADRWLTDGDADLAAGYPLAALAALRVAFNSLILAFYWRYGILPRSQNRTDALLRAQCRRLGRMDVYALYRAVYGPFLAPRDARRLLAACREEVDAIIAPLGPGAPAFFRDAVDGQFMWGQTGGILTVHRLYVPLCLRQFHGHGRAWDDPDWRAAHAALCTFAGLDTPDAATIGGLYSRVRAMRVELIT